MGRRVTYILELIVALVLFWVGMTNMTFLFVTGTRAAAITLGTIGILFYVTNTMGYVLRNPLHPISLAGSIFAIIGVILLLIQVFGLNLWIVGNPYFALTYFTLAMATKSVLAMFMPLADMY